MSEDCVLTDNDQLKILNYSDEPISEDLNASNDVRNLCFQSEDFLPYEPLNIFLDKDNLDHAFICNCGEQFIHNFRSSTFYQKLSELGFVFIFYKPIPEFDDKQKLWTMPNKLGLYITNFVSTIESSSAFDFDPNPSAEDINRTVEVGARVKK